MGKCSTWRGFERLKQKKIGIQTDIVITRADKEKFIISPAGLFRVHFDTSTTNAPALLTPDGLRIPNSHNEYADSVAKIFDEVYSIEIEEFGYPAPAKDGIRGGGNEYDIYIENLNGTAGEYGGTDWDDDTLLTPDKENPQYPAYITIDNDFQESGYYTKGLDAVRVTAAHEFHHMIEVSTSGIWWSDFYFYEMSATSMESTVYPEIKDYIQYIKTFFNRTEIWPLFIQTEKSGYERAIFTKFLMEKFGSSTMNYIWTAMKSKRPIPALQNALEVYSTTLQREFSDFSIWAFYTNVRTDSVKYFKDAKLFPPLKYYLEENATSSLQTFNASMKSFTLHYFRIYHGLYDSSFIILANTNYDDAVNELNQDFMYEFRYSTNSFNGLQELRPNFFAQFSSIPQSELQFWKYTPITSQGPYVPSEFACFPNPFDPTKSPIIFNAPVAIKNSTELYIYTSSMDLIYSGSIQTTPFSGRQFAAWNGRDNNGNLVSSGIYFYYLTDQKSTIRGKFAVIR